MSKISGGTYVNNTWRHPCRKYLETLVKAYVVLIPQDSRRWSHQSIAAIATIVSGMGRGNRDRSYSVFLALERHGLSCGHRSRGQQKNNDTCAWRGPQTVFLSCRCWTILEFRVMQSGLRYLGLGT